MFENNPQMKTLFKETTPSYYCNDQHNHHDSNISIESMKLIWHTWIYRLRVLWNFCCLQQITSHKLQCIGKLTELKNHKNEIHGRFKQIKKYFRSGTSPLEWLYSIAFIWYSTIGVCIGMFVGIVVSLISGQFMEMFSYHLFTESLDFLFKYAVQTYVQKRLQNEKFVTTTFCLDLKCLLQKWWYYCQNVLHVIEIH